MYWYKKLCGIAKGGSYQIGVFKKKKALKWAKVSVSTLPERLSHPQSRVESLRIASP